MFLRVIFLSLFALGFINCAVSVKSFLGNARLLKRAAAPVATSLHPFPTAAHRRSSNLHEQKGVSGPGVGAAMDSEVDTTANATASAVEYLVDSIRSGRVDELQQRGFQVVKKPAASGGSSSKLLQNLDDDEVVRYVLDSTAGEVDAAEVDELEQLLQQRMASYSSDGSSSNGDGSIVGPSLTDIDPELNADTIALIQREAQLMMQRIASDDEDVSEDDLFSFDADGESSPTHVNNICFFESLSPCCSFRLCCCCHNYYCDC